MNDLQFRQLLDYFGFSWDGYRRVRKGVKKRINRHMQQLGCRSFDEYLHILDRDGGVRQQCECLMTVSVSRFFRDRMLWKILEAHIVPEILRENPDKVKFWDAGCACGEEVYSMKMLWETLRSRFDSMPDIEVWATDINPVYLRRARRGLYSIGSIKEVEQNLREIYFIFQEDENVFRINPSLQKGIFWKVHNMLHNFEENNFHIIFLRNNLLTYYRDEIKQPAFQKVVNNLAQGGFLIIGSHEKVPFESDNFVPFHDQPPIFKKIRK
jgi:chemotaxis protein methyltransferase CheR